MNSRYIAVIYRFEVPWDNTRTNHPFGKYFVRWETKVFDIPRNQEKCDDDDDVYDDNDNDNEYDDDDNNDDDDDDVDDDDDDDDDRDWNN